MKTLSTHSVLTGALVGMVGLLLSFAACGGGSSTTPPNDPAPTISGVSVSCSATTVAAGQALQCSVIVTGTGAFNNAVNWSTSGGTISSTGLLTAPASAGSVTISATSAADPTKQGTAVVTVTSTSTITGVSVSCSSTTVAVGGTVQCAANVTGTGNFDQSVNWSASAGTISSGGLFTAPATASAVTISAASVANPAKSGSAAVTVTSTKSAFEYKGITHVSWWHGEYSTSTAAASEADIATTGSNWAGLLLTQYMASRTSATIAPTDQTPTDTDLVTAIAQLHNSGLKVMLKPHVDVSDGSWRGQIAPASVPVWFQNFTTFITHYAQLAQTNGVEMLCIGTEYVTMSGSANKVAWESVIAAVRAVYSGKIVYAANATYAADEFTSVSFWDSVDVIGLDAYFPLTNHADPTVSELVAAWSANRNGENIVQSVVNFAAAHPGKPVVFTEIGYRSVAGANISPWDYSTGSAVDNTEQQNCYEAMYRVWSQHPEVKGNFWWDWPVSPPGPGDTDYNPRNKPAETTMQNWLLL